jgi:membrane protein involved in colicin uptake
VSIILFLKYRNIIMHRKIVITSLLALFMLQNELYSYGGGGDFGGGFATGALLGTGITLAATSNSRNNRDPYYDLDRAKAQQEIREMRAQDRIRREEERQERLERKAEERREREHQRKLKQKQRDKNNNQESNLETKASDHKEKSKNKASQHKTIKPQQNHAPKSGEHKKTAQSPESLQLEIKKLELEIAQLKLEAHDSENSQAPAGT